jgi:hypothetical protein
LILIVFLSLGESLSPERVTLLRLYVTCRD